MSQKAFSLLGCTKIDAYIIQKLLPSLKQMNVQAIPVVQDAFTEAEIQRLADELEQVPFDLSLIVFQSSFLKLITGQARPFAFYDKKYPVYVIFEEELLMHLFYTKDYKDKNIHYLIQNSQHLELYKQLGYNSVSKINFLCLNHLQISEFQSEDLCFMGNILEPKTVYFEQFMGNHLNTKSTGQVLTQLKKALLKKQINSTSFFFKYNALIQELKKTDPEELESLFLAQAIQKYFYALNLEKKLSLVSGKLLLAGQFKNKALKNTFDIEYIEKCEPQVTKICLLDVFCDNGIRFFQDFCYFNTVLVDDRKTLGQMMRSTPELGELLACADKKQGFYSISKCQLKDVNQFENKYGVSSFIENLLAIF